MTPQGLQISTPTDTTIVLTRSFKAPRRLVWQAMTEPDKMRRWMVPPPHLTISSCEVEPRKGGAIRIAWKTAEADPAMTLEGEWLEWSPHDRMVHTEIMKLAGGQLIGSLVEAHEFTEQGGVTTVRITQTYQSREDRDGAAGANEGMEACYQLLDGLLAA